MKSIFYTALLTTALSLPGSYALAQSSTGTTSGSATMDTTTGGSMNTGTDAFGSATTGVTGSTGATTTTDTGTSGTGTGASANTTDTTGTMNDTTTGAATTGATTETGATTGMDATTGATGTTGTASATGSVDANTTIAVSNLNEMNIRQIQTALRDAGFPPGPIDGVWGPRTAASLQRFQQNRGLDGTQGAVNSRAVSATIRGETLQSLGIGLNEMQPAAGQGMSGTSIGLDGMDNTMSSDDVLDNDRLESNGME